MYTGAKPAVHAGEDASHHAPSGGSTYFASMTFSLVWVLMTQSGTHPPMGARLNDQAVRSVRVV